MKQINCRNIQSELKWVSEMLQESTVFMYTNLHDLLMIITLLHWGLRSLFPLRENNWASLWLWQILSGATSKIKLENVIEPPLPLSPSLYPPFPSSAPHPGCGYEGKCLWSSEMPCNETLSWSCHPGKNMQGPQWDKDVQTNPEVLAPSSSSTPCPGTRHECEWAFKWLEPPAFETLYWI